MKTIRVVPVAGSKTSLKSALKNKERELRGSKTTFKRKREGRWVHVKYPGWITWDEAKGGILVAKVHTRSEGSEWQLLRSFIGYLDRHLGDRIDSVTISYR